MILFNFDVNLVGITALQMMFASLYFILKKLSVPHKYDISISHFIRASPKLII